MEETYTFSRALHLMRYGGKNMAPRYEYQYDGNYYFVMGKMIMIGNRDGDIAHQCDTFDCDEIMGEWVEVK